MARPAAEDTACKAIDGFARALRHAPRAYHGGMPVETRAGARRPEAAACAVCEHSLDEAGRCSHCGAASEVGRYRIVRMIAQGPHGRMYLAVDAAGNRVALKELVLTQVPDLHVLESFRREGEILRELSHRNIPKFLESFEAGEGVHKRLYLAQEFVEGETLEQRLKSRRITESEAKKLGLQVLDVLTYLQSLSPKVIHRDIKPANLVVRPDGSVALVDFGAARDATATLGATIDVGTFGYMPPEQLAGEVDDTSDVYALGATLLHALTRQPPREILGTSDRGGDIRRHVSASPSLRQWIERVLSVAREDRFKDAASARAALLHPPPRSRAAKRSREWLAPLMVLLIGGSVCARAIYWARYISPPAAVAPAVFVAKPDVSDDVAPLVPAPANPMANEFARKVLQNGSPQGIENLAGYDAVKAAAAPDVLRKLEAIDLKSVTACQNLDAIWAAEQAYHTKHGKWLTFEKGDEATWKELGVVLPREQYHVFSGVLDRFDGHLILMAQGNLDGDPFLDRWHLDLQRDGMGPNQDDNDALNLEFDGAHTKINNGKNGEWAVPWKNPAPAVKPAK